MIVKLAGEAESVKFGVGAAFTVRETVVLLVRVPEVPVMVTVAVPVAAVLPAVSVRVLLALLGLGLSEAVTPLGKPEADRLTLPLKPFCGMMAMVLVPLVPCTRVKLAGEAESVKLGAATPTDTLSKVALARAVVLPLFTAKPM